MSGRLALSLAASAALGAAATTHASTLPRSAIAAAAARKHRRLQSPASTQLTDAQYDDCQADLLQADANADSQLSQDEFLAFLSYNSGRYGQSWGYASNQQSLGELPLEFPLLFHATACQCAYDNELFEGDMGCCTGENGHIIVYPGVNADGSEKALSAREEAYTREFCGEAFAAYGATVPTPAPTVDALEPPTLPPAVGTTTVGTTTAATTTVAATTAAATTTRAFNTPAPTPGGTAAPFALTPPTLSAPPTNAPAGGTATPPPSRSPVSMSADQLEVGIQYGISSNCGMTAFDVMSGTGGITIKEGLIAATEATVVGILNATYPRDGSAAEEAGPTNPGGFSGSGGGFQGKSAEAPASMHGVRTRVDGAPHRQLKVQGEGPHSLHYWHNLKHREQRRLTSEKQQHRSLAYYTQSNPAVITDVEDVVDAACPFGINCMRVSSTVFVTLEEGDDPAEVEAVIRDGIQASFADASFFEAIPEGTVFCPPVADTTTAATATADTTTAAATTGATPPATTTQAATTTTTQTATTPPPVPASTTTTSSTITTSSAASGGETGPIEVSQTYDISNNCGWDAEAVMNPVDGNTLKEGLIEATRTVTIGILNETYPRADDEFVRRRNVRTRKLAYLADRAQRSGGAENERSLAYYTDQYPVTIDRVLDIVTGCDPDKNCLLVVSTITVVTEEGDDPAEVYDAISAGFKESFVDGSFFAAVPEEAASCPTRR
ncbi:hypothetical protein ACHAXT_012533 [Thalassiosira profunda]